MPPEASMGPSNADKHRISRTAVKIWRSGMFEDEYAVSEELPDMMDSNAFAHHPLGNSFACKSR